MLDLGRYQQVRLTGNPQELLRQLAERTTIRHFEEMSPTLHDIFIRIAGPAAQAEESQS